MNSNRNLWLGLATFLFIGLGFLVATYAARMWNSGHYQFFVIVIFAVAGLLWSRLAEIVASRSEPNARVSVALWLAVAVFLAVGNVTYSGLVGILATIAVVVTTIYSVHGWGGLRAAAPTIALLGFVVPLPLMLDQALIVRMQLLASELASRLLDGVGIVHVREGVMIETPGGKFITEEACSGIRSLFSSLAVVAMHGVALRHRWWRIVGNLAQGVLWVLVGNSLRVALVVAVAGRFPWVATGLGHELIGLLVFAFILAMVASVDTAFSFWVRDYFVIDTTSAQVEIDMGGPTPVDRVPSGGDRSNLTSLPPFPITGPGRALVFAALGCVVLITARTAWVRQSALANVPVPTWSAVADPQDSDFSGQYGGFTHTSFTHKTRGGNPIWAENSFIYQFKRNELRPILSIDRPWNHWHNLHVCYTGIGWHSTPSYAISSAPVIKSLQGLDGGQLGLEGMGADSITLGHRHSELMLKRQGRYGFVIFSAVDRWGDHVSETVAGGTVGLVQAARLTPEQLFSALGIGRITGWPDITELADSTARPEDPEEARHLERKLGSGGPEVLVPNQSHSARPLTLPVSTVQVFAESPLPWTEPQLDSLRALFFILREQIAGELKRAGSPPTPQSSAVITPGK